MFNETDLSAEHASILVATSVVADAELVEKLLRDEFRNVHVSVNAESAVADFETRRPAVLVLAFDTLEAAQRYYLGLYRLGTTVHTVPHRTVVLCHSRDLSTVYELCRKEHFDDYVLFWPAANDAPRIRMTVHQALKLMRTQTRAGESLVRAAPGLAASAQAASAFADEQRPDQASPAAARADRPVVLMVEDDEFQQKLLSRLLSGHNVELHIAGTGAQAHAKMWELKPDLVLMDVGLPDTNGVEATRKIKAIAQFAHIPIVMVTGHSERHIVVESLKAGAADFLVKPFDRDTLLDKLRLYLPATAAL